MRMGLRRRSWKRTSTAIIMILAVLVLSYMIILRLQPTFVAYARESANNIITSAVNKSVAETFSEYNSYDIFQADNDILINDVSKINTIKTDIITKIQNNLAQTEQNTVNIPLGNASGLYLLNGLGPNIKIKIIPLGMINVDFEDSFEEAGINFVKHTMYIKIDITVHYRGFVLDESETITNRIPIVENISSGEVPQYYGINSGILTNDA